MERNWTMTNNILVQEVIDFQTLIIESHGCMPADWQMGHFQNYLFFSRKRDRPIRNIHLERLANASARTLGRFVQQGEWLLRGTAALAYVHTRLFGCDSSDYCTVDNAKREDSRIPSSLRKRKRRATMTLSLSLSLKTPTKT